MVYERIVWQYWEHSPRYPDGIPYIELCHKSVDLHQTDGQGYKVVRLNQVTVSDYIDLHPLLSNVSGDECQLAQKADFIRARLLCKYGGIWLDSDVIVLGSLDSMFDKLNDTEYYGYQQDGCPCIWAFACHRNSTLMKHWIHNNDLVLEQTKGKGICFGEMGHRSQIPFIKSSPCILEHSHKVNPIDHTRTWEYMYKSDGLKHILTPKQCIFVLNNNIIEDKFKKSSIYELSKSNILLVQILRFSGVTFET